MTPRIALGLLAVGSLTAMACGSVPRPEGFSVSTSSTAPIVLEDEAAADSPETGPALAPQTRSDFVPLPPADYVPEVLIGAAGEVFTSDGETTIALDSRFEGIYSTQVVDDLLGGLVVERLDSDEPGATSVVWLPAQGEDPIVLARSGVSLLDVGYVDGSPSAAILVDDDQIDRVQLVGNVRTTLLRLEDDEQLIDLSASGGLHAMVVANERCGDLRFFTADGTEIMLRGPGEPDCIVPRRSAYSAVALSPDRGALAYTLVTYRDDGIEVATELVARDLTTGQDFFRRKIGEDGDRITDLSFDGDRVVYLRQSDDDTSVTVLEVQGDQRERRVELTGGVTADSVSFARLPLATPDVDDAGPADS